MSDFNEPLINFADERARIGKSQFAARKKRATEELEPALAKPFDTFGRQLRDNRCRADFSESIEAPFDPFEHLVGRNSIQDVVANVCHERRGWKRWTPL